MSQQKIDTSKTVTDKFHDDELVLNALNEGVRRAIQLKIETGKKIPHLVNGQIIWRTPSESSGKS